MNSKWTCDKNPIVEEDIDDDPYQGDGSDD